MFTRISAAVLARHLLHGAGRLQMGCGDDENRTRAPQPDEVGAARIAQGAREFSSRVRY